MPRQRRPLCRSHGKANNQAAFRRSRMKCQQWARSTASCTSSLYQTTRSAGSSSHTSSSLYQPSWQYLFRIPHPQSIPRPNSPTKRPHLPCKLIFSLKPVIHIVPIRAPSLEEQVIGMPSDFILGDRFHRPLAHDNRIIHRRSPHSGLSCLQPIPNTIRTLPEHPSGQHRICGSSNPATLLAKPLTPSQIRTRKEISFLAQNPHQRVQLGRRY